MRKPEIVSDNIHVKCSRRVEPLEVSKNKFQKIFKLDNDLRPLKYVANDYIENIGGTIMDRTTGLLWQRAGFDDWLTYKEAKEYVHKLNRDSFAGYNDWRFPTIEELTSLLESEKRSNNFYINPIFDAKQCWCWSSDSVEGSERLAWLVCFDVSEVSSYFIGSNHYVRAVRTAK